MKLNDVADYKVLVVGDAIIDRYRFCDPLGRSTKDAILSVKFLREEEYQGGVWACASHIKDLCATVDIWHGLTAVVNTKYIGRYSQKLFSIHEGRALADGFHPHDIASYDVVIAFDYGHGFFSRELRDQFMREARFLAVNAQTNSSNYGFNRLNERWPTAHLAVCDEMEARLAAHEADCPLEDVILKLPYTRIIVTTGPFGAIGYANREFYREKALTDRPIDLLGAGDAVLSVVAPFARAGASIKELVHLGNIAGAIKVGILGHQTHITKAMLEEHLK